MPSICQCGTIDWKIESSSTFLDTFSANCKYKNISLPLSGQLSSDPLFPGNLKEGFAAWALVPNMVYNLTSHINSAGEEVYDTASVYSCLGLGLFSFQLLSRTVSLDPSFISDTLQRAAAMGLNVEKVHTFNFSSC